MLHARLWIVALVLLVSRLVLLAWRCRHAWHRALPYLPKRIRRLHPSTPDECLHCRHAATFGYGIAAGRRRRWAVDPALL